MKPMIQFAAMTCAAVVATCQLAIAGPVLNTVPEPGSLALIAVGVVAMVAAGRKKKK